MKARKGEGGLYRHARSVWHALQGFYLPLPRNVAGLLYSERSLRGRIWSLLLKALYREPLFRYRCESVGRRLSLEGEIPLIIGDGRIVVGDNVRIGRRNTWIVGFKVSEGAELVIGDDVSINYQTTISVAKRVVIGSRSMIAGNVQIYDNVSHPVDPARRHEPFGLDEASAVIIGENVWLGNRAIIMRGVTIGDNSVVAAASVVTKDVPADVVVAGNPAAIIKRLDRAGPDQLSGPDTST
jgi:acetyltransferase-like isoleucine patch superfamily enzyme